MSKSLPVLPKGWYYNDKVQHFVLIEASNEDESIRVIATNKSEKDNPDAHNKAYVNCDVSTTEVSDLIKQLNEANTIMIALDKYFSN